MSGTSTTSVFVKPEFWATLVTGVSGLLLTFGVITQEQADGISWYVPNIIGAVMSLLSLFKFVGTQHAAKVEVFRALCAARAFRGTETTVQASCDTDILSLAREAGL